MDIIEKAKTYAKDIFINDYSGHDFDHTIRVYNLAVKIAEKENADIETVSLAALLHDVDDIKLSPETHKNKDKAVKFLNDNSVSEEKIKTIVDIISQVSFEGKDSVKPSSLEGMCVQDADRLDAIGAIGVARTFAYGGSHKRKMYDHDEKPSLNMSSEEYHNHVSTTLNHFYEKLFLLKDMLNTETAKKIADKRDKYMHEFVEEFILEWNGKR